MENLSIYFLKASSLTALFFIAYYVLLRKETFFKSNRWFLLAGLFTSALLPLVVFKKIVWIDPAPQIPVSQINVSPLTIQYTPQPIPTAPLEINWHYIALLAYGAGILFFAIRFAIDLYKVYKMLNGKPVIKQGQFRLIDATDVQSPFSFFNYIVYNSATLQLLELNSIISHEKVHSSQRHSLDILLAQLFCLAFWFNPIAWLYKRAISQNLEFIADAGAITFIDDKVAYQKTLLKITVQPKCIAITNHFYQSLIKKRIVMINKQQSHRINSLKYGLVLPVLGAFIFLFQIEVVAQEKEQLQATTSYTVNSSFSESIDITKNDTDEQLKAKASVLENAFDADVKISNVKRNKKNEITGIKVAVKLKGQSKVYDVSSDKAITNFTVQIVGDSSDNIEINFITLPTTVSVNQVKGKVKSGMATITSFKNGDKDAAPADVLYIIDGVKQKPGSGLSEINPDDIEKIEVRKDTDNIVKLYGEDAKNGVILVTTKKSTTKPSGTFNGNKKFGSLYDPQAPSINMGTPISRMAANGIVERRYTVVTDGKQNDSVQAFKSGVKYVAYANSEIEDPATYVSYNVSAIKGKGNISRKKYSEMTADELTKAYESQETVLRGIKKLDKKIKASGDKEYSDNMEALKNAAQQAQKEIRQAQKDLKRRS